jgi:hypothetical protein
VLQRATHCGFPSLRGPAVLESPIGRHPTEGVLESLPNSAFQFGRGESDQGEKTTLLKRPDWGRLDLSRVLTITCG